MLGISHIILSRNPPIFSSWRNSPSGPTLHHYRGYMITLKPQSITLLWTSDQPDAETSTLQHTIFTTDRHPCPQRDSNPPSQQVSGRRPTPQNARPLGSAPRLQGKAIIRIVSKYQRPSDVQEVVRFLALA